MWSYPSGSDDKDDSPINTTENSEFCYSKWTVGFFFFTPQDFLLPTSLSCSDLRNLVIVENNILHFCKILYLGSVFASILPFILHCNESQVKYYSVYMFTADETQSEMHFFATE